MNLAGPGKSISTEETGEHECPKCGKMTSDLRKILLNIDTCRDCTPQLEKPLAVMEYSSKNVGELVICPNREIFKELKKPANKRR